MVTRLKDEGGTLIEDQQSMVDKFIIDYINRCKSTHGSNQTLPTLGLPKQIFNLENNELIRLSNTEEVQQAVFSINSNKTPDPAGFGGGFFKHYWNVFNMVYLTI